MNTAESEEERRKCIAKKLLEIHTRTERWSSGVSSEYDTSISTLNKIVIKNVKIEY